MKLIPSPFKVANSIEAMLGYWDLGLRCRYSNAAYKIWFGKSHDDMAGIPMRDLLGPLYSLNLPHIQGVLDGKPQHFERAITLPDGSIRHSLATYHPDIADGTLRGFTAHIADVTKLKIREIELEQACALAENRATHDFLTGLPNRVNLLNRIDDAILQAAEEGHLAAVVILDCDDFKLVNDTYGHVFGDSVLRVLGDRMIASLRGQQRIKRYGGDEFVLIVPNVNSPMGIAQMVRRWQTILSQPMVLDGIPITLDISCGVSLFPTDGTSAEMLLHRADQALYQGKRQGKGQIVFATP
jgi:diguanylate cyclase (GGDEF)-like protein/PAS domain S-box-containing protein